MKTVRTIAELRKALDGRPGARVGLVPTMGALHEGHLSLIREARERCDVVVVSIFVNPTQFTDAGDLAAYPRDAERDAALAAGEGADLLLLPAAEEIYPPGHATVVRVTGVSEPWEGAHRGAAHFDGVATVVTLLLLAVRPDVVCFGQKDAQQLAVVARLVTDLRLPLEIVACPTVREPDGLAMSSRNVRLAPTDRERALALKAGLDACAEAASGGAGPRQAEQAGRGRMLALGVEPEYLALVDPQTFAPATDLVSPALAIVAAHVGEVRLIDNLPVPAR